MNKIVATAIVMATLGATSAHAQTLDLRTFTCADFAKLAPQTQDLVVTWIEGFVSEEAVPEEMTVDFSQTDTELVKAHCAATPEATVIKAVVEFDQDAETAAVTTPQSN